MKDERRSGQGGITDRVCRGHQQNDTSQASGESVPNLKQHLWAHAEEAVHYPKGEYHRHAVDVSCTEE